MGSANDTTEPTSRIEPTTLEKAPEKIADAVANLSAAGGLRLGATARVQVQAKIEQMVRVVAT